LDLEQLREYVVEPVLYGLPNPWDVSASCGKGTAVDLVCYTIAHESGGGRYIRQLPDGPAMGICQMEPDTYFDNWNYLDMRKDEAGWNEFYNSLCQKFKTDSFPNPEELYWNNALAVAMCRLQYLRQPETLPDDNYEDMAEYWFDHYNRNHDVGKEQMMENFIGSLKSHYGGNENGT